MKTTSDMLQELAKPMSYKWRVQSASQYGATCVAYIDARDVQQRLDEVCGLGWKCRHYELKGRIFCEIGIINTDWADGDMITRTDCGAETQVEMEKGESSDAFKRAAVMFGVGRFLYDLGVVKLPTKQHSSGKYHPYSEKTGKFIRSAEDITKWCNAIKAKQ